MHTTNTQFDIAAIEIAWQAFNALTQLQAVRNEANYARMLALIDVLLHAMGNEEDHPLSGLLDLVGNVVAKYEQAHYAIDGAEPREILSSLMEGRSLRQEDLASVIAQSNLSAILAGKRPISAPLATKLGRYFGISPVVFLPAA